MSSAYITTKFISPTNNRGSRVKASCQAGSITIPWAYEYDIEQNHISAFRALVAKLNIDWGDSWTIGANDAGYVFVPVRKHNNITL